MSFAHHVSVYSYSFTVRFSQIEMVYSPVLSTVFFIEMSEAVHCLLKEIFSQHRIRH